MEKQSFYSLADFKSDEVRKKQSLLKTTISRENMVQFHFLAFDNLKFFLTENENEGQKAEQKATKAKAP